ncbi:MAG: SUMF1/EgtB/PvdO family nonheme iron enzyme [Lentisphaeria bacterium]|nr:SUMF1/EgtB/PvdO family nonheme iron enzyme [Lentisphaeria bacterium]
MQKSRANARYAEYRRMQAEINARFAAEEKAREEKRDAAIRELTKEIFGEEFVRVGPGKIDFGESVAPDKRILKISQPFWLGRTEVTWRQWAKIMGGDDGGHPDLPVIVTGETARQFCQILNRRYLHRLDALRCRFELPVPHYWRYAAAGGDRHRGVNVYSGSDKLDRVGWYAGNSGGVLHNVAQKQPNELGLFDMSGNAGELCDVGFPVYKTCTVRGGNAKSTAEQCRVMTESAVRSIFSTRAGFRVMLN